MLQLLQTYSSKMGAMEQDEKHLMINRGVAADANFYIET
jgi:hypothetical protein